MPTGRLTLALVAAMLAAAAGPTIRAGQTPPAYPGYALVWSDEFDRPGEPDPKRWTYERGFVRNRELQWYQPQNARQADGLLVIEARRERVANPGYKAGPGDWRSTREFAGGRPIIRWRDAWDLSVFDTPAPALAESGGNDA